MKIPLRFVLMMALLLPATLAANDSYFHPGPTGSATLSDTQFQDLDYSKSFSVEALLYITPNSSSGRWAGIIAKTHPYGGMWLANIPGWGISTTYEGPFQFWAKQLQFKIGDNASSVGMQVDGSVGWTYLVMAWNVSTKTMSVYRNGVLLGTKTNSAIVPLAIKNSNPLQIGAYRESLNYPIPLVRLWNRELTSTEATTLWTNFEQTRQHILPSGFNSSDLFAEWRMEERSDATHLKDTVGSNHLALVSGATQYSGAGPLELIYPLNGETGVDKSVTISASGGVAALSGPVIHPLHYYFQVDETSNFNSPALKESGWSHHFGDWRATLAPNKTYFTRVKVRDSSVPPKESSYTGATMFTTEGVTNWYVRPKIVNGSYGTGDGTSYANAWNGLHNIVWGEGGVEAGDNLYIAGKHIHKVDSYGWGWTDIGVVHIGDSGASQANPVTIRMDYPGDTGYVYEAAEDLVQSPVVWNGPDSNGVYWATKPERQNRLRIEIVPETDHFLFLRSASASTWTGAPGSYFEDDTKIYVKTSDGSNPTGKIFSGWMGYAFDLSQLQNIVFFKCNFRGGGFITSGASHITFDGCDLRYKQGTFIPLSYGNDYWTIKNSRISYAENGIYTTHKIPYGGANYLLVQNNDFYNIGIGDFRHKDGHSIGVQAGEGHIIEHNRIDGSGSAIEFWSGYLPMRNMIVRYNLIKNVYVESNTGGGGITISGTNYDPPRPGYRSGFEIYGNIIMNTGIGSDDDWQGYGIRTNSQDGAKIYNNVLYNTLRGISLGAMYAPLKDKAVNNMVINVQDPNRTAFAGSPVDSNEFVYDYNLFYPKLPTTNVAYNSHAIYADPLFVSNSPQIAGDFNLKSNSPAIDAGVNTGVPSDIRGVLIPQGSAPDIGAFERSTSEPVNLPPTLSAIGNRSVDEERTLEFDLNAIDPEGQTIQYLVPSNLPYNSTFIGKKFKWTPNRDQAGIYTLMFMVSDGERSDSELVQITVNDTVQDATPSITSLILVNAETNKDIKPLQDGMGVNLAELNTNKLTIRAETSPQIIGSIAYSLIGAGGFDYTDNTLPYTLRGEANGQTIAWSATPGKYTVRATAYSKANSLGTPSVIHQLNFTISNSNAAGINLPPGGSGSLIGDGPQEVNISCTKSLTITDRLGHIIRTLPCEQNSAVWNVKNDAGKKVASGIYYVREVDVPVRKIAVVH